MGDLRFGHAQLKVTVVSNTFMSFEECDVLSNVIHDALQSSHAEAFNLYLPGNGTGLAWADDLMHVGEDINFWTRLSNLDPDAVPSEIRRRHIEDGLMFIELLLGPMEVIRFYAKWPGPGLKPSPRGSVMSHIALKQARQPRSR